MANLVNSNYKITKTAVAFAGSVDAGKSTLLGCLAHNILDDGRGSARNTVSKHQYEKDLGRTSDIVTHEYHANNSEAVTFVDLCGHEKYFKTTSYGISGYFLDYAVLVVSCNRGILLSDMEKKQKNMTLLHLKLLLSYNIPFIVVVTHIDQMQEHVYNKTKLDIVNVLKRAGGKQTTTKFVNDATDQYKSKEEQDQISENAVDEILNSLIHIANGKQMVYPVLNLSNKTGAFLNVLKTVFARITPRLFWTPGGAEMVTQNKVVKQQLNSLEKQYGFYKMQDIENYRQKLSNIESIHPDLEQFMKSQLEITNGDISKIDQIALANEINQLVDKFDAITTEKYFRLSENLQPVFQEFNETIFYVDSASTPPGTQLVLSGICRGKRIAPGDIIHVGPIGNQFVEVRIKTIHNNVKEFVPHLDDHDRGSLSVAVLKKADLQRKHIKKGTICVSNMSLLKNVCYRFKAIVKLNEISVTMKTGTTPVIHLNTIAQPARMIIDPNENGGKKEICFDAKTTSVAVVTFKFKMKPAFVEPYNLFVLRSGDIHGVGLVIQTLSMEVDTDAKPDPVKAKKKSRGIRGPKQSQKK